jgi:hypothetical protein
MTTGGRRWNGRSRRHRQGPFFLTPRFYSRRRRFRFCCLFFLSFFVSPNSVCVPLCILAYARNGNAGGESPVVDCCQAQALAVGMWAKTVELQFLGRTGCSFPVKSAGRAMAAQLLFQPPVTRARPGPRCTASGAAAATTSAVQSGSAVPIQLKKPRQPRHYGRRPARRASWPSGGEEDAARGSA